ncbi:hypothetical protein [Thauera sinica]|uniref:Phage portal protein n=1 Tax=Thauera sinica TaxID=2665146 RepID=A0ABW1AR75_9RHOO|nr:hypothetical protein [Thauera sp. K11]ATE60158.1 hypothetical protein CCZ27_09545 [Thauera sp. K11]
MGVFERIVSWWVGGEDESAPRRMVEAAGVTVDADDEEGWRRLSGDTSRDLSPLHHSRMRETAYYLWDANLLANRLIELPLAYLLAEGVSLQAADPAIQKVIERWWDDPINALDVKLEKKLRELALFGEQCWPVAVNEFDGHVRLGYLDPALIATVVVDPDNTEQPIGIVTTRDKHGKTRRYRIIINGPEDDVFTERTRKIRETFDDGECFYFCVNALSTSARGRSDLRAPADWVDAYDQFLFGEAERYNFLRAFVWDVTLAGATKEQVEDRAKRISAPSPGSVRVHNDSETWQPLSPSLDAADASTAGRLFRNHVLGGATIPEHWFGGGGDVNRATGESMAEPTLKAFTMRQRYVKHMLGTMARYVIRQHILARASEPVPGDPRLVIEIVFPEMTSRDTTKYASALAQVVTAVNMAIEAGRITEETGVALIAVVAAQMGVDIDPAAEMEAARAAAAQRAEADTFTGPTGADLANATS